MERERELCRAHGTATHQDAAAAAAAIAARGRRGATWRHDCFSKRRAWVLESFAPLPRWQQKTGDVGSWP
jgi:hypothetical protein